MTVTPFHEEYHKLIGSVLQKLKNINFTSLTARTFTAKCKNTESTPQKREQKVNLK